MCPVVVQSRVSHGFLHFMKYYLVHLGLHKSLSSTESMVHSTVCSVDQELSEGTSRSPESDLGAPQINCLGFWGPDSGTQGLFMFISVIEITSERLRRSYGMPGTKPRLIMCKADVLPPVLLFQLLFFLIIKIRARTIVQRVRYLLCKQLTWVQSKSLLPIWSLHTTRSDPYLQSQE